MADPLAFLYYRPPECQWPGLWDRLPQELLDKVSELMDTETRLALALTSRWMHWRLKMTLWRSVRLQGKGATFSPNLDHFIERATVAQRLLYVEKPFTSYIRQATIQPSEQRIILDGRWSHSIVPPPNMPLDDLPVQIFRAVSYMTNVRYLDIWLPHLEPHSPSLSAHLNGYSSEVQTWDSVRFLRLRVKDPDLERFILERLVYNLEGLHIEKTVSELDRSYFLLHPQLQRLYCNLDEWLMLYDDDYDPTIEPSQIPRLNELFPDLKWLVLGESTGPSPPGENFEKDEYVPRLTSLLQGLEKLPNLRRYAVVFRPGLISDSVQAGLRRDAVYHEILYLSMQRSAPRLERVAVMEDHPWYFESVKKPDGTVARRNLRCDGAERGMWPAGINSE